MIAPRILGLRARVESVEVERVGPEREELSPPLLEDINAEYGKRALEAGATEFEARSSAIRRSLSRWEYGGQMLGGRYSGDALCSGCFLKSSDGTITYTHEQRAAYSPEIFRRRYGHYPRVEKRTKGGYPTVVIENVGVQSGGAGRARGRYGWSDDSNVIAGALASFEHNFIATLVGYFERAKLPATQAWALPNLVLAETRVPDQFVPEASYSYRKRPSVRTTFLITTNSSTEARAGMDIWGTDKESVLAEPVEVDIPAGETEILLRVLGAPYTGFFNINPVKAPKGITIEEVRTSPISF